MARDPWEPKESRFTPERTWRRRRTLGSMLAIAGIISFGYLAQRFSVGRLIFSIALTAAGTWLYWTARRRWLRELDKTP